MKPLSTVDNWYNDSVVYNVYAPSFCDVLGTGVGNIEGVLSKLKYIATMGFNTLYLQGLDVCLPHLDDATDASLQRNDVSLLSHLVKEAHLTGIYVLVDMPIHATSPTHPWFSQSAKGIAPFTDYYIWKRGNGAKGNRPPDRRKTRGISVWQRADNGMWYVQRSGSPLLNLACSALRSEMENMALTRLAAGVDGFVWSAKDVYRPHDAAQEIYDYLRDMLLSLRTQYDCRCVLDVGDAPLSVAQSLTFTDGIRSSRHLPHTIREFSHPNLRKFKHILGQWQLGTYGRVLPTLYTEGADLPRAFGWLTGAFGDYRKEATCTVATAIGMLRGTPFLYQGQEIGMVNYPFARLADIEDPRFARFKNNKLFKVFPFLGKAVLSQIADVACDNAHVALPWTALLPNAGFSPCDSPSVKLPADYRQHNIQSNLERADGSIAYITRLNALRLDAEIAPVLKFGTYKEYYPSSKELFVYSRSYRGATIIVVCNMHNGAVSFTVPDRVAFNDAALLLGNYDVPAHLGTVTLRPYECMVYRLK